MLHEFLDYLKFERRLSPHTVKAYRTDLDQFSVFISQCAEETALAAVDRVVVRSYMVALMEGGASPRSVHRKISALRAYFKWLRKSDPSIADPTATLIMPKLAKRLPTYVEESQMAELDLEGVFPETFIGTRDRLIVELLYQTGMRGAEIIGLKMKDLDLERNSVKVLGKRNKERIIPISPSLGNRLGEYLQERMDYSDKKGVTELFINKKGNSCYPKLVYRTVNTYLGNVSSLKKKSPHVLRHSFATHMLNRGADINAIKELLGHASLAATQVYTHTNIEKLKNIHRKAHPNG